MKKIAIFASGSGSNAENIIQYFAQKPQFCVKSVFCNVPDAYVLERAKKYRIPSFVFNREEFRNPDKVFRQLQEQEIDFIVLAGFLWLMPSFITAAWPNKIVNIHPALLPAYGGKGMYGHHVHEAVIAAGEKESGITIHYVNDHYICCRSAGLKYPPIKFCHLLRNSKKIVQDRRLPFLHLIVVFSYGRTNRRFFSTPGKF